MYSVESPNPDQPSYSLPPDSTESSSDFFRKLTPAEQFWCERFTYLLTNGYRLRPRYDPNWIPSWVQSGITPTSFFTVEDACHLPLHFRYLVDATRLKDGKRVYLKRIERDSKEIEIMRFMSDPVRILDPRNHCVPLLDALVDPLDGRFVFIVIPFLRSFDNPPFENVNEFLDFGGQVLEGLAFMHENGVAHRDCTMQNIRMEADSMFPSGFHPVISGFLPDLSGPAWPIPRSSTPGVRYYFTDFGISVFFPPDYTHPRLVDGSDGLDQEPPELYQGYPYDPFKLDVFIVGNLFRRSYLEVFSNLTFLAPLVDRMTSDNPLNRPEAFQALEEWNIIRGRISYISKNWRLRKKEEPAPVKLAQDIYGLFKTSLSRTNWIRYL